MMDMKIEWSSYDSYDEELWYNLFWCEVQDMEWLEENSPWETTCGITNGLDHYRHMWS